MEFDRGIVERYWNRCDFLDGRDQVRQKIEHVLRRDAHCLCAVDIER